ncbi:hypothetical protein VZT92_027819 [Zoarces viviparus]|uniref:Uncharacterized protein n=1 Tax=Zoarces viviparus TaxID=48416 RepID=A0AAW1DVP7_ZOAVI
MLVLSDKPGSHQKSRCNEKHPWGFQPSWSKVSWVNIVEAASLSIEQPADMYSASAKVCVSTVGRVVAALRVPPAYHQSELRLFVRIPQRPLASPSGAERRDSDSSQAPPLHTSLILMGTEGWRSVACVSLGCVCVCVYGGTRVRITQVEHVRVLLPAARRSIHAAAAECHDDQSPPRHHLPPLCQFVTAHPSVAVPSLNIERERDPGRKGKGRNKDR